MADDIPRLIETRRFADERGWFEESYNVRRFAELGVETVFVQDNHVRNIAAFTLRGLHFQGPPRAQAKLIRCPAGALFDVAVDIRVGSPTFGRWEGVVLSSENGRQLFIPAGFAHGFVVTGDEALVNYKCTEFYRPGQEYSVLWSDPDVGIPWPVESPTLSPKDAAAPRLADIPPDRLPRYEAGG